LRSRFYGACRGLRRRGDAGGAARRGSGGAEGHERHGGVEGALPGSNVVVDRIVDLRVDDAVDPFKELRRLLDINLGTPRKLTDRSSDLAIAGKFDEAIAVEKQALEIQPNSDTLHYALAQRYAQADRPLQALVELREAIRLHPNLARQAATDPIFAKMRGLAEFKRLIQVGGPSAAR
jgi:tetratricopeptide (TPR) repeat protein